MDPAFTIFLSVPSAQLRAEARQAIIEHLGPNFKLPQSKPQKPFTGTHRMMEPAGEGQVQSVSQIATQLVSKTIKSFRESLTQVSEISAFWDDCLRYADAQAKMPEESVKKLAASVWQEGQAWVASITPEIECRLKTLPNRLSPAHHKKALETLQATFQMRSPITSGALSKQLKSFQKANPQKSAKQRMS